MKPSKLGAWAAMGAFTAPQAAAFAQRVRGGLGLWRALASGSDGAQQLRPCWRGSCCIQALGGAGQPIAKPDEDLLKRFAPGRDVAYPMRITTVLPWLLTMPCAGMPNKNVVGATSILHIS
jgi:hypothetical protein